MIFACRPCQIFVSAFLITLGGIPRIHAEALTPGDLLVAELDTGQLVEYAPSGAVVQQFLIPDVDGDGFHDLRDVIVDAAGNVQIYNGTFDPFLTTLVPTTGALQHHTFTGWSTVNNVSFGGIGALGDFVFATDMRTFGDGGADEALGIIRFNRNDFSATRFATFDGYQDLAIGLDGLLYALPGESLPASRIDVFNPHTLALIRSIPFSGDLFGADIRGIAVDSDGKLYLVGWNGGIYQVDSTGTILNSVSVGVNLSDVDIRQDDELAIGTSSDQVILTTTSLADPTPISASDGLHVAFVPPIPSAVPEPSTLLLVATAAGIALIVARLRRMA